MLVLSSTKHRVVRTGLLFLVSLGGWWPLFAPSTTRAQAPSTASRPRSSAPPSAPANPGTAPVRALFQKHCVKCHGADGTGEKSRDDMPEIPDFTRSSWQAQRSDARLLASILNGRGDQMPPWRTKLSMEQARSLVRYTRAFAPTASATRPGPQGASPTAGPEIAKSPRGRVAKLIRWLGNFHPPAAHFPIALLTAAAVAELLRMATGKPAFEAITRYCVWFGTLTAVLAGVLGWFLAGFHLTDASRVLMTHRWLGTTTVACAALVLALSEAGRPPDRGRTRLGFRVALLVVAILVAVTGFFGGAVVYGLDHYTWPR